MTYRRALWACALIPVLLFDNEDPNFAIQVTGGGHLSVDMDVLELSQPLASQLAKQETREDLVTRTKSFFKSKAHLK